MASYEKRANGWRVQVKVTVNGELKRDSSVHATKAQAAAWAAQRETELRNDVPGNTIFGKTLGDACARYELEVSRTKRGHRWEALRLAAFVKMKVGDVVLGTVDMQQVTPELLGKWRDMRLQTVKGSTINRELNLISHVLSTARDEWQWIKDSPTNKVRRPKDPEHRSRLVSAYEIEKLELIHGFNDEPIETKTQAVMVAFLFSIETAMRLGEIARLRPSDITGRVAHLKRTKNGTKRDVPLSPRALKLLSYLPVPEDDGVLFMLDADTLSTMFRKATAKAMIDNLHFHDARHQAITNLAKKLNVLDLARMTGIKDLKILNVYYNETAEDMAGRLEKYDLL